MNTYRTRRDAMLAALDEHFPAEASWTRPEGGFFVWVTLPATWTPAPCWGGARARRDVHPGDGFFPDGKTGKNCMRIAFCYESPENLAEAVKRLAGVINDRLELYRAFIDAGALPNAGRADAASRSGPNLDPCALALAYESTLSRAASRFWTLDGSAD